MQGALAWLCACGVSACAAPAQSDGAPAPAAAPAAAVSASLAGTRWIGVVDAAIDSRMTPWLEFMAEGRVSGFSGCNLLNGGWRNEGAQIRIGPLVMTKRGCTGAAGDLERRVLAVLNDQGRASREGARLVVVGPGGERFEFTQAASAPR